MKELTIYLRDLNPAICKAWDQYFEDLPSANVDCNDIFSVHADAIVSPANSFGYMDGGIDLLYMKRFGWELQDRLRDEIDRLWAGEMPIGAAVVVPTEDEDIPFLISAPTMRVPENVSGSVNAYLAFRAALRAVENHNAESPGSIASILCPGLGTMTGKMHPIHCAKQMRYAWDCHHREDLLTTPEILGQHRWMTTSD